MPEDDASDAELFGLDSPPFGGVRPTVIQLPGMHRAYLTTSAAADRLIAAAGLTEAVAAAIHAVYFAVGANYVAIGTTVVDDEPRLTVTADVPGCEDEGEACRLAGAVMTKTGKIPPEKRRLIVMTVNGV